MKQHEIKFCVVCGRKMQWRKKWERDWDNVRYCSAACRKNKIQPIDIALEQLILELLRARKRGASICPSEVARAIKSDDHAEWRNLMEPTRNAARRLVNRNLIEITQRGRIVDPSFASGPIRLRLVEKISS